MVIQDILKEIAQTQQVDLNARQRFKGALSYPLGFLWSLLTQLLDIHHARTTSSRHH